MYSGSFAFTLAETLITIGMIGVIAALTLPTLMNSTNDKETVARVKKVRATVNEAYGRAYAKYGPINTWFTADDIADTSFKKRAVRIGQRMSEFLQVEKDCNTTLSGCFASGNVKYLGGGNSTDEINSSSLYYKMILSDGTSLAFSGWPGTYDGKPYYYVIFDIDGPIKGKNTAGIDNFNLWVFDSGVTTKAEGTHDLSSCKAGATRICTDWVIMYDNLDYLHIDSSGKCPNGTVLSDTNPTCN